MKLRGVLFSATALSLSAGVAIAQPISGVYVGGGVGYNWMQDQDVKSIGIGGFGSTGGGNASMTTDGGFVGLGSIGWGFGNGLRAELEGNYRGLHQRLTGAEGAAGGASLNTYGAMVNVLYDFNSFGWVAPYIGAGVGYEVAKANGFHAYSVGTSPAISFAGNGDSIGNVGVQAILGAAFATGVPGLAVTAEYRFMGVIGDQKVEGIGTVSGLGSAPASVTMGNQYNHAALIGLRYAFNAAPPPPPPAPAPVAAPAPAPARTYLVFFDWDRADLSARAKQVIAEAAQASTRVQLTQIEVNGFTDTSGSAQYNMGLSIRRANNVAAELVRLGVPKQAIAVKGFGQTHLLVPTADGVREPQNRRVEIILK